MAERVKVARRTVFNIINRQTPTSNMVALPTAEDERLTDREIVTDFLLIRDQCMTLAKQLVERLNAETATLRPSKDTTISLGALLDRVQKCDTAAKLMRLKSRRPTTSEDQERYYEDLLRIQAASGSVQAGYRLGRAWSVDQSAGEPNIEIAYADEEVGAQDDPEAVPPPEGAD